MNILIDENVVYGRELFGQLGQVTLVPGRKISEYLLQDVNTLIIRSVTQVNASLIKKWGVTDFIGTVTAGTDHVDQLLLHDRNIVFSSAPGSNAVAVVEYVFSALLTLAERDNFDLRDRKVGIVGVGNIGSCLRDRLKELGVCVLLCDPPRADRGEKDFCSLENLVKEVDILTLHTPLYREGQYKTFHLADGPLIAELKKGTILINTSRGPVVDNIALLNILENKKELSVVMDVWESEPDINLSLLEKVDIGTPHIAGYTLEGKTRGTIRVFEDLSRFVGYPQHVDIHTLLPKNQIFQIALRGKLNRHLLKKMVYLIYDVRCDDALLRLSVGKKGGFDKIRKYYRNRREWSSLCIQCESYDTSRQLSRLGFTSYCTV